MTSRTLEIKKFLFCVGVFRLAIFGDGSNFDETLSNERQSNFTLRVSYAKLPDKDKPVKNCFYY